MTETPDVDQVALHERLRSLGATVGVAESLTGGLVTATLTEGPGASVTVRGGLVVYATETKALLAGVAEDLLAERGPVDPDVAAALARGARDRLTSTYGLGVTGVAGPEPQDGKPVGTVYAAVAGPSGMRVEHASFDGSRDRVRSAAVQLCLQLLDTESARDLRR